MNLAYIILIGIMGKFVQHLKHILFFLLLIIFNISIAAQLNTENQFAKPLKEVLSDVQKKYNITIKYTDSMVGNKIVTYADWKYRTDVDVTLENILAPLELKVKKEADKKYKLSTYEYYRWNVQDGWAMLDKIALQHKNLQEWELRKADLKTCLLQKLQLTHLPAKPNAAPIKANFRKQTDYTIENIAIEILPGVWVNGSLYKPLLIKSKIPVVLHPQGHWEKHRYRTDCQFTCAAIAKMGAMVFNYDMFAYGESMLQFKFEDHRKSLAMTLQILASIRILDYLLSLKDVNTNCVAIAGGSGGGTHAMLMAAIDDRIKAVAPIVSLSSYFYGGCPCESGQDIHSCGGRTNNVELAAMAAPKPMLVVSDGGDWTDKMPEHDFLYLQKMYAFYDALQNVTNVHLPNDKHDFGINKRTALYQFLAKQFNLNLNAIKNQQGNIVDTAITIEPENAFFVFGDKGEKLPAHAVKGFTNVEQLFFRLILKGSW